MVVINFTTATRLLFDCHGSSVRRMGIAWKWRGNLAAVELQSRRSCNHIEEPIITVLIRQYFTSTQSRPPLRQLILLNSYNCPYPADPDRVEKGVSHNKPS